MGILDKIEKEIQNHPLKEENLELRVSYLKAIAYFLSADELVTNIEKEHFSELIRILECEDIKEDLLEFLTEPDVKEFKESFVSLDKYDFFTTFVAEIIAIPREEEEFNTEENRLLDMVLDMLSYTDEQKAQILNIQNSIHFLNRDEIKESLYQKEKIDINKLTEERKKAFAVIGKLAGITVSKNTTYLDLSRRNLTELPKEIGNLTNLTSLSLNNNKLTKLPKEIGNLTNLTSFYLPGNRLTELPKEIGNLTNLTNLELSFNSLTELPKEIGNLTNLTSLDLLRNSLTELPKEIGNLTNLTGLDLRVMIALQGF